MKSRTLQCWLFGIVCPWLMMIACLYGVQDYWFRDPLRMPLYIATFFITHVLVFKMSVMKDHHELVNQEHFRPKTSAGIWCISLLPLAIVVSHDQSDLVRYSSLVMFMCTISIKQLLFIVVRQNLVINLVFTFVCLSLDLSSLNRVFIFLMMFGLLTLCDKMLMYLPRLCSKTFTYGECCILTQSLLLFVACCINLVCPDVADTVLNPASPMNLLINPIGKMTDVNKFVVIFSASCLALVFVWCCMSKLTTRSAPFYLAAFAFMLPFIVSPTNRSTYWLITFCTSSNAKISIICYWLTCSIVAVLVVYCYSGGNGKKSSTIVRKIFHVIALAVYIPGIVLEPELLFLASIIAFHVFIFLEFIRLLAIKPLGPMLNSLNVFRDGQDSGHLLLTHIYLLVGFSCPLWICPSTVLKGKSAVELFAGVISLGFCDTAASIGGSMVGHTRWPNSHRTIEGSVFALSATFFSYALVFSLGVYEISSLTLFMAALMTTLMEGLTTQIDNLVLPFFMYCLLCVK